MLNTKFYKVAKIVCAVFCAASPLLIFVVTHESMSDNMFWSRVFAVGFAGWTLACMYLYFRKQQHKCEQWDNDMQRRREARRNRMENR